MDCQFMVSMFADLCQHIGVPIAHEKTSQPALRTQFLGIVIDGEKKILRIPSDKQERARHILQLFLSKKKGTVKQVESLAGLLNFFNRAIFPGRTFTRRMYAKVDRKIAKLRPHHHISLDWEFRQDCMVWLRFLSKNRQVDRYCRPFTDLSLVLDADLLNFYTDSSANISLGFGGIFNNRWFWGQWEPGYINRFNLNIEYLEFYAVCMGVFIWTEQLCNLRVVVDCDNSSVVRILNKTSSGCKDCMQLMRRLTLHSIENNFRIFGVHVEGSKNQLSMH